MRHDTTDNTRPKAGVLHHGRVTTESAVDLG